MNIDQNVFVYISVQMFHLLCEKSSPHFYADSVEDISVSNIPLKPFRAAHNVFFVATFGKAWLTTSCGILLPDFTPS